MFEEFFNSATGCITNSFQTHISGKCVKDYVCRNLQGHADIKLDVFKVFYSLNICSRRGNALKYKNYPKLPHNLRSCHWIVASTKNGQ